MIVSDYLQYGKYAANVFLKNHSATSRFNCPPVSESCHIYVQIVPQVNLNWTYCWLASQLGRNGVHDLFAASHCNLSCLVDGIGGTIKRLVSHGVMSGKAEVVTSSEFASRSLTEKDQYFV